MTFLVYDLDPAGREITESLRIFRRRWTAERYASKADRVLYEEPGTLPPVRSDTIMDMGGGVWE